MPGRQYRVEFKDRIEDAGWSAFSELFTFAGTVGSATDTTAARDPVSLRFYRVVLVP